MVDDDDIDGLAAEYVLGSLDAGERKKIAARRTEVPQRTSTCRVTPTIETVQGHTLYRWLGCRRQAQER